MKKINRVFIKNSRPTLKLTISYLTVIMVMSVTYSLILYFTSSHDLEKRPNTSSSNSGQRDADHVIDEWLGRRAEDNKNSLASRLFILNVATLLGGSYLSYYLARRTLRPIERSMQDQDRFIADASHELRTPLTTLLLGNEVALRKKHLSEANARSVIEQNISDIKELKTLSDNLLDLAADDYRSSAGKTIRLEEIATNAVHQVSSIAIAKDITITVTMGNRTVVTDKKKLTKVLVVLLDNAIKYSSHGTTIYVSQSFDGKQTNIHVKDKGEGIAPADLSHIFERFYRADQSRSQSSGYGLGLAIATKLVEQLGGKLTAESELYNGSIFTVHLFQ